MQLHASVQPSVAATEPGSEGTLGATQLPASNHAPSTSEAAPVTQHADVQTNIVSEALSSVTALQLESLSERVTIMEQLCQQLGASTDKDVGQGRVKTRAQ